jgi:two-component system cell cycle response regulator
MESDRALDGAKRRLADEPTMEDARREIARPVWPESGLVRTGERVEPPIDERRDTPLFPSRPKRKGLARPALTITTGLDAGRLFVIPREGVTVGRSRDAQLFADDPGVSARHAYVGPTPEGGYAIEDLGSTNGTFVGMARVERAALSSGDQVQLGPAFRLRYALMDDDDVSLRGGLYEYSVRDSLTRAFNRRYLLERLFLEILHVQRAGGAVAIVMFDLDHFKALNDTYGHLAGDRALLAVADDVRRALRREDVFARYGGEEFIILARETTHPEAIRLAERVRRSIAALCLSACRTRVSVTVSVGVASLSELDAPTASARALIALADTRLYAAKAAGRDRVCARS